MRHLLTFGGVALCACTFLGLSGCAVGRAPNGGAVIGIATDALPETAAEAANAAAGLLPPPWGQLVQYGLTAFGVGGLGVAATQRAKRTSADSAWDEAEKRTNAARDRADAAFDEASIRERLAGAGPGGNRPAPAGAGSLATEGA